MITKEREVGEKRILYRKALRLITGESAHSLSLIDVDNVLECPVFVSPQIKSSKSCEVCSIEYKPLIYQTGYVIIPHHFHEYGGGGIYYDFGTWEALQKELGWISFVEPIGIRGFDRAEKVQVDHVKARCTSFGCDRELIEGVVLEPPYNPGSLKPECEVCFKRFPTLTFRARFNFKITEEGEVLFSNI